VNIISFKVTIRQGADGFFTAMGTIGNSQNQVSSDLFPLHIRVMNPFSLKTDYKTAKPENAGFSPFNA
jgi:hypothetical protein